MNNEWCAIDLHMHTRVGVTCSGQKDSIINFTYSNFIDSLKSCGVKLGAITNHNIIDLPNYLLCRNLGKKMWHKHFVWT